MLLSLSARPLWGFGGKWKDIHSIPQLGMDQRKQAGPMPWALPGQAPGLESWAGSAEGDCGHLRMVRQGILVRRWVSVPLCLAGLGTVGREAQPSTHVWPAWPGYHWTQIPFLSDQQAWTQREVKTLWGTSSLEGIHGDYSPFGVSPGASPHQPQVLPPVDPTGPGLPGQSSGQVASSESVLSSPPAKKAGLLWCPCIGVLCWHCVTVSLVHQATGQRCYLSSPSTLPPHAPSPACWAVFPALLSSPASVLQAGC